LDLKKQFYERNTVMLDADRKKQEEHYLQKMVTGTSRPQFIHLDSENAKKREA